MTDKNQSEQNIKELYKLVEWLEYGRESGYVATRQPKDQEERWAVLLKGFLDSTVDSYRDYLGG